MSRFTFYDPIALIDILSAVLVFYTQTPIPDGITEIHAGFLLFKGFATMLPMKILPRPFLYIGGFADLISAAILFTGQPPLITKYNDYIAILLTLKGVWSSLSLVKLMS